jgi:hypothetical protein
MVGNVAPGLGETFLRARQRRFRSACLRAHSMRTPVQGAGGARVTAAYTNRAAKEACNWGTYGLQAVHHPAADPASCSSSGRLSIDRAVQDTSSTAKAVQVVAIG